MTQGAGARGSSRAPARVEPVGAPRDGSPETLRGQGEHGDAGGAVRATLPRMKPLTFALLALAVAPPIRAGLAAAPPPPLRPPERHTLIASASEELREGSDTLATWSVRDGVTRPGTRYVRSVHRLPGHGRARWRLESVWFDSTGRVTSRLVSDADSALAPVVSTLRADRDSASLAVVNGRVIGWSVLTMGQRQLIDEPLPPRTVAPEYEDAAVAALPLSAGYRTQLAAYAPLGGVRHHQVSVVGRDTVTAAGAVRQCWKVALTADAPGEAALTLWVDRVTRRVWQRRGDYAAFYWVHRVTNP